MSIVERVTENLESLGGLHFSQRVLLLLTQNGLSREKAYSLVQTTAMDVWGELQKGKKASFADKLKAHPEIKKAVKDGALENCFQLKPYIREAQKVWARVLRAS